VGWCCWRKCSGLAFIRESSLFFPAPPLPCALRAAAAAAELPSLPRESSRGQNELELTCLRPSNSGYDFGYLLKIVSCAALPPTEAEFFELLRIWFPCIWDIKVRLVSSLALLLSTLPSSSRLDLNGSLERVGASEVDADEKEGNES
jgi:hypothetical protein